MEEQKKGNYVVTGSVVALIMAVAGYGAYKYLKNDEIVVVNSTQTPIETPSQNPPTPVTHMTGGGGGMMSSYIYKDGVYSATGNYFSPGGSEEIAVQVTLKKDVVVNADVQSNNPSSGTAARYQRIFISNFKQYVIGKKIDSAQLDRVSGSSLTPQGWNDAIAKIEVQAKV